MANGQVRVGYVHFAFLGEESRRAAEASECASDQNAFWEYHDKLFAGQSGENQGAFHDDNLKRFAVEIGLNAEAFDECLDSGKYAQLVEEESGFARSLGVSSTPTFVLNGRPLVGAQSFEVFQEMIEAELASSQ